MDYTDADLEKMFVWSANGTDEQLKRQAKLLQAFTHCNSAVMEHVNTFIHGYGPSLLHGQNISRDIFVLAREVADLVRDPVSRSACLNELQLGMHYLRRGFDQSPRRDEVQTDNRFTEMFHADLNAASTCFDRAWFHVVISSMAEPETQPVQFEVKGAN